jgi:serine/threonine-protein kinase RsbW
MPLRTAPGKATPLVTETTTELIYDSRIESIGAAAEAAAEFLNRFGAGEEVLFAVDMAIREAITNAVVHGNKQDESKKVMVSFSRSPNTLEIVVRDQGHGFDPEGVADPTDPQNLLKASGRGILFMRTFMDEVEWLEHDEGGTVVKMTKRL